MKKRDWVYLFMCAGILILLYFQVSGGRYRHDDHFGPGGADERIGVLEAQVDSLLEVVHESQ